MKFAANEEKPFRLKAEKVFYAENTDVKLIQEAIRYGQFADDATWQLPKPVRDAIKRLFPV